MENQNKLKTIQTVFTASEQSEGAGAKVKRFIGVKQLKRLDPFVMLDWFNVKLPAGFPDHPHRGFETVTYMLSGQIAHEDFRGHKGTIGPGDVQWMTAGKGILHAEMPISFTEPANGFQLWLNLEAKNKLCDPNYQEFKANEIPVYKTDHFSAKVIAGKVFGTQGAIKTKTPAYFLDFTMDKGQGYDHLIPKEWNSMIIVHSGSLIMQDRKEAIKTGECAVFQSSASEDEHLSFKADDDNTKFILLAGKPIGEPIAQHGPFLLNTEEQLEEAFEDYHGQKNGFEGAGTWKSEIRNLKNQKP